MPRQSREPLDKGHEILFFRGDWERLTEILAPRKVSPSEFIRELVAKAIRRIDARAAEGQREVEVDVEI